MKTRAILPMMLAAVFVAASACGADQSHISTAIAVVGATIIDGTGQSAIPRGTVLIEGDRIVAVGPSDEVEVPAGAQIVRADARWIMPGMIDLHVHFFESGRPGAQPDICRRLDRCLPVGR
jgi:imidazolonepropionase-like amidohydrolase